MIRSTISVCRLISAHWTDENQQQENKRNFWLCRYRVSSLWTLHGTCSTDAPCAIPKAWLASIFSRRCIPWIEVLCLSRSKIVERFLLINKLWVVQSLYVGKAVCFLSNSGSATKPSPELRICRVFHMFFSNLECTLRKELRARSETYGLGLSLLSNAILENFRSSSPHHCTPNSGVFETRTWFTPFPVALLSAGHHAFIPG